jgi:hypothetical protein
MTSFKTIVHQHFLQLIQSKIADVQQKLDDLKESLSGETKSTAGDKHETARAFVHIEQENTGRQLETLLQQKAELDRFSGNTGGNQIVPGNLVKTDKGYFYLSTGAGKAVIDSIIVFAISPASPLGKKLIGMQPKDVVEMNGQSYFIQEIL